VLELGVRRPPLLEGRLAVRRGGLAAAMLVDRDARGDREHPRAEVRRVRERAVAPKRAQERLLERVLRSVPPQPADEEPEDAVAVLDVEGLEGRGDGHRLHHRGQTGERGGM
jgi:hypothetical protein